MMARANMTLPLLSLVVLLLCLTYGGRMTLAAYQRTWCIANPSATEKALEDILNYACSHVSCSPISENGTCFYPNTALSHASVAMNLFYRAKGEKPFNCYFNGTGVITITDPSFGQCNYV